MTDYFIRCEIGDRRMYIKASLHDEEYFYLIDSLIDKGAKLFKIEENDYRIQFIESDQLGCIFDIEGETEMREFLMFHINNKVVS